MLTCTHTHTETSHVVIIQRAQPYFVRERFVSLMRGCVSFAIYKSTSCVSSRAICLYCVCAHAVCMWAWHGMPGLTGARDISTPLVARPAS